MIAISILLLTACSDTSLWTSETPDPGAPDPVFQESDADTDEDWGDDTGDTGEGGDEGPWSGQWGEVVFNGADVDEAITGLLDYDGTSVLCEIAYELEGGAQTPSCGTCTLGGTFTLGAPEVITDVGGRCAQLGWTGLQGETLTVGHADPDTLWAQDEGTWEAVGWSSMDSTFWEFEIEF